MNVILSLIAKSTGHRNVLMSNNVNLLVRQTIMPSSSYLSSTMTRSSFSSTTTPEVTHVNGSNSEQTRRRRKRRIAGVDGKVPSYKEFVHKFTVVHLYRDFLKAVKLMPHNQDELTNQVKMEFRSNQHDHDTFQVQRAMADGKRRFQELQEMTGYKKHLDADSWLNIKDEEDPRGRVGQGWPWNK